LPIDYQSHHSNNLSGIGRYSFVSLVTAFQIVATTDAMHELDSFAPFAVVGIADLA
jgi:hypothetical protein